MCRLFAFRGQSGGGTYLSQFAEQCRLSKEYQGDGWGIRYYLGGRWKYHKELTPVWEADLSKYKKATVILAHARSASFDDGPDIESNMPFETDRFSFVFNGELRGVRLKVPGKTGAEKLFRFILNFYTGNIEEAVNKALSIIIKRVDYIRALNFIILDKPYGRFYCFSTFSEDQDYFSMQKYDGEITLLSSDRLTRKQTDLRIDRLDVL